MRIKIEGKRTPAELGELITKVLTQLGRDFPELQFGQFNLYFTPLDGEGQEVTPCNEQGKIIEAITIPDPNKPKRVQKRKQEGKLIVMPDSNIKIKTG